MTYKRSAKTGWLLLLFAAAYLSILIYGVIPFRVHSVGGDTIVFQHVSWGKLIGVGIGLAFLSLGAVMIIRTARHSIVVDADGIRDTAAYPDRVPWRIVQDVALDGSEQTGYRLLLTVVGAQGPLQMRVELGGLAYNPSAVFGEVFDAWRAATGRTRTSA
ncbi:MAG TPA: hypothetical protein VN903_05580 [Polyangia bacterium]|jgi:hypothetical protein|nr:hypothetical protein [Polyangia bacterium]